MAKYCANCGRELPDEAMYCPDCGKEFIPRSKADFPENEEVSDKSSSSDYEFNGPFGPSNKKFEGPFGPHSNRGVLDKKPSSSDEDSSDSSSDEDSTDTLSNENSSDSSSNEDSTSSSKIIRKINQIFH